MEPRCKTCGARKLDHSTKLVCPIMDGRETIGWHSLINYVPCDKVSQPENNS